jgi:formylglycine-generating enzyme required for sulfatase activity
MFFSKLGVMSINTTRRGFLQLAGFAGVGFVASSAGGVMSQNLVEKSAQTPTLKTIEFETVTVNSTGQITKRSKSQAKFFTETIANGITLDMMAIPGGSFVMGSPNTEAERENNEGPQHTVNVAAFFMGKYEVTQAEWRAVGGLPKVKIDLNANPSNFKGDDLPVETVSWDDAIEFCARLSQVTGRNYRLPSEAEWEYACRAGTTTPFHFGETITSDLVNHDTNYPYGSAPKGADRYQATPARKGTDRQEPTPVGSFGPNTFGLYDMHGNVWEWCQDTWHANYNGAPTDGSAWESGGDSQNRLLRGGSWGYNPAYSRAAYRGDLSPGMGNYFIGFRVVCVAAWTS